jgi:hypothetical protein
MDPLLAQKKDDFNNTLSVQAYLDFTKSGIQSAAWITYDYKKFSAEARYNYDWENNVSIYAGAFLKYKSWDFHLLQGLTFGNTTGISFSPTVVLEKKKLYFFNQAQYVIGLSKMPSYFSQWGEIYFKPSEYIWIGITERIYYDKTYSDIAFGPQVSLVYNNIFITFYYWIPSKKTESKAFLQMGYEQEFKPKQKN